MARRACWSTAPASAWRSASSAVTVRMALADFDKVIKVNLIGTFNMIRLAATEMSRLEPTGDRRARRHHQYGLGRRL